MDVVESATIREPLCPFLVCSTLSLDSRFASRRVCFVSGRLVVALLAFFFLSLFFFFLFAPLFVARAVVFFLDRVVALHCDRTTPSLSLVCLECDLRPPVARCFFFHLNPI